MGVAESVDVDDVDICWGMEEILEGLERVLVSDLVTKLVFLQM
jgi:hypothetical protein